MEVPQGVRENVQRVLLRTEGIFLDRVCEEYQRLFNCVLPFRGLGYNNIEAFLRSLPDVARLKYSAQDQRMKAYSVITKEIYRGSAMPNRQGLMPLPQPRPRKVEVRDVRPGERPPLRTKPQTGAQDDLVPDHRGVYTLCFPSWKKPDDLVGTLDDMFSVAGEVYEIDETQRWIYVCYTDIQAVQRAFKMFGHLGLKVATESALKRNEQQISCWKRKLDTSINPHDLPRKRKRVHDGPFIRVYVGNLNPLIRYTFDNFRKLFHDYRINWVSLNSRNKVGCDLKLFAYILVSNRKEAEKLAKEFNGYVWHGHKLEIEVKEKKAVKEGSGAQTDRKNSTDTSVADVAESCDGLPSIELGPHDMPGLEPAMPGLEPAMPGLESAMPGLESAMPGLEPAVRRLESVLPPLEPALPGLEPILPPLEPAMPGLEPVLPPLELAMPGLEPIPPRLERLSPEQDCSVPLENFRVQRSFDIPTVVVTSLRDDVDEAALASLFAVYRPKLIRMACTQFGRKKAFIQLGSVDDVKQAVNNLNQAYYQGVKMKVDVPYNMPELREAVLSYRQLHASSTSSLTLSDVLQMRGRLLSILQVSDFCFQMGQQVEVLITTVISDKFFWGQVIDLESFGELRKISESLNSPVLGEAPCGPGRCKARFQGDGKWYRAWVMHTTSHNPNQARVFYIDYGNTAEVPWNHTAKAPHRWLWQLRPLAIPITLIEGVPNLKDREMTNMIVEVNAIGNLEEGNMVVGRAVSLVPNMKETISNIIRTVIL